MGALLLILFFVMPLSIAITFLGFVLIDNCILDWILSEYIREWVKDRIKRDEK